MKQIATIILVFISLTSFGQGGTKFTVKGNGTSGSNVGDSVKKNTDTLGIYKTLVYPNIVNTTTNTTNISLKRNISDTAGNAGVTTIFQVNKSKDSLQVNIQKNTDSLANRFGIYGVSGINRATQFLGTTNNTPLPIRINNLIVATWDTATKGKLIMGNSATAYNIGRSQIFILDTAIVSNSDYRYGVTLVPTYTMIGGTYSDGLLAGSQTELRIGTSNTASYNSYYPLTSIRASSNTQPGSAGTVNEMVGVNSVADLSGMTLTRRIGFKADNAFLHGTAAITNQYGIVIQPLTGATNNFGIVDSAYNNQIVAGTLPDGVTALTLSATMPTTITTGSNAVNFQVTGAGSSSQTNRAFNVDYLAGYTGSSSSLAARFNNAALGTGVFTITGGLGNYGIQVGATGVGTGSKIGVMGFGQGGDLSLGVYARANQIKNSAIHIAALNVGRNSATGGIGIATYSTNDTAALITNRSATRISDNGNTGSALDLWYVNKVLVATMSSTGALRIGDSTSATDKLEVTGNIALTTAGNKLKITTGSNASIGVSGAMTSGTITISTTAVTASSRIFLTHATTGGTTGVLTVGTIVAGTSFVINSSNAADTGTVNWWIIN